MQCPQAPTCGVEQSIVDCGVIAVQATPGVGVDGHSLPNVRKVGLAPVEAGQRVRIVPVEDRYADQQHHLSAGEFSVSGT